MIYLDPPFFSKKDYENIWIKDKATKMGFSDKDWDRLKDKVNPDIIAEYKSIEERWRGGKNGIHVYIAYMRERLDQCWRVLKDTGSIYLHCDWHASHYLKIMLDEVFGYSQFRNEIVWCYAGGGIPKMDFPRKHDVIFRYSKTDARCFNPPMRNYSVTGSGIHSDGSRYDKENDMTPQNDWWIDIAGLNTMSKEKQGYPTQKPEMLLDRIIGTSSNKGWIVLDPFCGCGTTLASSQRLERKWIGIDISRTACDVMVNRLGGSARVVGCESPKELQEMDPHDFARLVIVEKLNGTINPKKSGDGGIDGWIELLTVPVQVKRWKHKVGRPEIDKFKTAIERDRKGRGMVVAHEFSRDAINEVARIKNDNDIVIELKHVRDVFGWSKYDV